MLYCSWHFMALYIPRSGSPQSFPSTLLFFQAEISVDPLVWLNHSETMFEQATQYKINVIYKNHCFGIMHQLLCNYQVGYLIIFVIANS